MSLLFGNLTQDFVNFSQILMDPTRSSEIPAAGAEFRHSAGKSATYLVCIGKNQRPFFTAFKLMSLTGIGMFVCTYTYMYIWVYTGEINAKRIRERYLQAILRQDIAFFDDVGAGEVATRIQTDTRE